MNIGIFVRRRFHAFSGSGLLPVLFAIGGAAFPLAASAAVHSVTSTGKAPVSNSSDRIRQTATSAVTVNSVISLGTLGGMAGGALGINESGMVVGFSATGLGVNAPFRWTPAAGMVNLGSLGGSSQANAINDEGHVVGVSRLSAGGYMRAFLWTPASGMVDLGSLTNENSDARDINNLEQVVGDTNTSQGASHAFLWSAATGMQDLGTLAGTGFLVISSASGISDSGHVVGSSKTASGSNFHAFLWTAATGMTDLGTLGGMRSFARDVNNLGHVVGVSEDAAGHERAFLWTPQGGMEDLGTLPGGTTGEALGINDQDQVVGRSTPNRRPFFWTRSGGMIELPPLFTHAGEACALNEMGQIVGDSVGANGLPQPVLWTLQPSNSPPVANAGSNQTVECANGGADVTLDGSGSTDPDDGIASYEWREGSTIVATGATPQLHTSLGIHTLILRVTDHGGLPSEDQVVITVRDTTAPAIGLNLNTAQLWPPNHSMHRVASGISAGDGCDSAPSMVVSVASNEPAEGLGDGDTAPDWQIVANADGTFEVWVRAERSGHGTGRIYTITAAGTDASGNQAIATATVSVPKTQGRQ